MPYSVFYFYLFIFTFRKGYNVEIKYCYVLLTNIYEQWQTVKLILNTLKKLLREKRYGFYKFDCIIKMYFCVMFDQHFFKSLVG